MKDDEFWIIMTVLSAIMMRLEDSPFWRGVFGAALLGCAAYAAYSLLVGK